MNNHYFSNENDKLSSNPKQFKVNVLNTNFLFETDNGVFAKKYLDYASKLLVENVVVKDQKTLLDVGCGYGVLGIILSKVYNLSTTMIDVNPRALLLAKQNAQTNKVDADIFSSDLFVNVNKTFDLIISNPPIRAGKKVIYKLFEDAINYLNENGEFWIVIQYAHGAPSAIKELEKYYKTVSIEYKKKGFYIVKCLKN